MAPHLFPQYLEKSSVKSPAEYRLFNAFKQQLSSGYYVFHSVSWLGVRKKGWRPSDGEADFVIAHPDLCILVLEVKGGKVGFNNNDGWFSVRWDNERVTIKNPFEQAKDNKYALIRKIKKLPNWQGPVPSFGHAVAFPDGILELTDLGPEAPEAIILMHEDMSDLSDWIYRCNKFWCGERHTAPGESGVQSLRELLARTWLMRDPKIGEEIDPETSTIDHYTEEQFKMLDILAGRPRAAIRGCAGSGKTELAIKKARQLASQGFRVLLTCYNKNLAEALNRTAGNHPRLRIQNFHAFCKYCAKKSGYDRNPNWDETRPDFFDITMPEAITEAVMSDQNFRFDALVVDEGQDFAENWWTALEFLLEDPIDGLFYIFFDDNQHIYSRRISLPVDEVPFALTTNCRNTRQIYKAIEKYYLSDLKTSCQGPEGRSVKITPYQEDPASLREVLTEALARLVYTEKIDNRDIVILSPGGINKPPVNSIKQPGPFKPVPYPAKSEFEISCTTIRKFKGLESPVVLLIVPPGMIEEIELMYVGLSRACNHLEVIINEQDESNLEKTISNSFS